MDAFVGTTSAKYIPYVLPDLNVRNDTNTLIGIQFRNSETTSWTDEFFSKQSTQAFPSVAALGIFANESHVSVGLGIPRQQAYCEISRKCGKLKEHGREGGIIYNFIGMEDGGLDEEILKYCVAGLGTGVNVLKCLEEVIHRPVLGEGILEFLDCNLCEMWKVVVIGGLVDLDVAYRLAIDGGVIVLHHKERDGIRVSDVDIDDTFSSFLLRNVSGLPSPSSKIHAP